MGISDLLEIFKTFGWPGFFAAVSIIVIYFAIKRVLKNTESKIDSGFEKLSLSIAEQNKQLITAITDTNKTTQNQLFTLMSKTINTSLRQHDKRYKKSHEDSINRRLEVSEEINAILWDLMNHYNSQRAILIEFHNSKENLNGLSFLWYDIQYEKQARGIDSISAKARNLQASNLIPIINMVNASPSNIVILHPDDIENIYEKSTVLHSHFKEIRAAHILYCGIYSDNNKLIGLVAIEYQEGFPYHEDIINFFDIKDKCGCIGTLLNFIDIYTDEQQESENNSGELYF